MVAPLPLQILCAYICRNKFYKHIWESRYDQILEIRDNFQNININVVFLLIDSTLGTARSPLYIEVGVYRTVVRHTCAR